MTTVEKRKPNMFGHWVRVWPKPTKRRPQLSPTDNYAYVIWMVLDRYGMHGEPVPDIHLSLKDVKKVFSRKSVWEFRSGPVHGSEKECPDLDTDIGPFFHPVGRRYRTVKVKEKGVYPKEVDVIYEVRNSVPRIRIRRVVDFD